MRCQTLLLSASIAVRDMQPADVPAAARLLSGAFAPVEGYNWVQARVSYEETRRGLADRLGATMILVAEAERGNLVGTVEAFTPAYLAGKEVRFWDAELPLVTYISSLATDEAARRRGVAAMLVRSVEARTREAGEASVSLQVDASNHAALALYEKLGYAVVRRGMTALTTPSRYALVSSVVFGGVQRRSLLALQKQMLQEANVLEEEEEDEEARGEVQRWRLRSLVRRMGSAVRRWTAAIWALLVGRYGGRHHQHT